MIFIATSTTRGVFLVHVSVYLLLAQTEFGVPVLASSRTFTIYKLTLHRRRCPLLSNPVVFPLTGGPSQIDHHNVDMANQLNRSEGADVRGVKDYQGPSSAAGAAAPRRASKEEVKKRFPPKLRPSITARSLQYPATAFGPQSRFGGTDYCCSTYSELVSDKVLQLK